MIDCYIIHVRLCKKRKPLKPCNKHVSGANITCARKFPYKLVQYSTPPPLRYVNFP